MDIRISHSQDSIRTSNIRINHSQDGIRTSNIRTSQDSFRANDTRNNKIDTRNNPIDTRNNLIDTRTVTEHSTNVPNRIDQNIPAELRLHRRLLRRRQSSHARQHRPDRTLHRVSRQ